ncbi:MAG: SWIM zinc finger family protein [Phycisphaerae bacterium]|nr:SWIM zinc finger family protein [Phycisphaerae bacterium]
MPRAALLNSSAKQHRLLKNGKSRAKGFAQPSDLPLEQWQIALRKQFAQKQAFRLKNIGDVPIFSEFMVTNPQTNGKYRLAIRGQRIGDNYCSCPDFAVNTLGTCKHIEFALAKLQRKRGGRRGKLGLRVREIRQFFSVSRKFLLLHN